MEFYRPYGVAAKVRIPVIKAGADDFAVSADWTPATGDVKVSKDGGAIANAGTLPAVISGSGMWEFTLSATEMEADEITVTVIDAATKAVKDQAFSVRTSIPGAIRVRKAQAGAASTITLDAGASATTDLYNNAIVALIGGTGAGQQRIITAYNGTTKVATVDTNWATNPDSTSIFAIMPLGIVGLTQAQVRTSVGLASANLDTQLAALQADTDNIQTRLPAALVGGRMDSSVGAMANNVVTAAAIATDAIDADAIAASAVTEIQSGLAGGGGGLDAAGVRAAIGLGSANLDTQLGGINAKTTLLNFTSGNVHADIKAVIADPVVANSTKTTNWGGTA